MAANSTGYPGPDGTDATGNALNPTLDSSCTWAGAPDSNGQLQPLVSDNPTLNPAPSCCAAPSKGGGFTAEVVFIQNASTVINGFDVTLSWDTKILNAVEFDQGGLPWFGGNSFTATNIIDNTAGTAELGEALLSPPAPLALIGGNQTLFRIRFDVVGIGTTNLQISNDQIIDANLSPNTVHHITVQGSFTSSNIPDFIGGATLGYSVAWSFAPNPEVPGSTLTLVATASCMSCTLPLSYRWDTDSVQAYPANTTAATVEAVGQSVQILAPTALLLANRVTLIVADASGRIAEATRQLPLAVAPPPSQTVGINAATSLTAKWLGGIPPYSGTTGQVGVKWILCNSTGVSQTICTNPNPSTTTTTAQLMTVSNTYKWAGVFTGTVTVTDTGLAQLPATSIFSGTPSTVASTFSVNVTGSAAQQAYIVTVASNATSGATTAQVVSFNATVAYASTYTASARSSTFSYTFRFGDGQTALFTGGTIGKVTHKYAAAGTYSVVVIARETGGNALAKIQETSFSTFAVYVPLTGTQGVTAGPPMSGTFTFTGTGSGGQAPYTYSWDFGDGTTATGSSVTHTYSASGTYVVTLTTTDAGGRTFTSTQTVIATVPPTSNLFYAEVGGGIAAVIAAIAALMIVRRRRKAATSTGTSSTTPA